MGLEEEIEELAGQISTMLSPSLSRIMTTKPSAPGAAPGVASNMPKPPAAIPIGDGTYQAPVKASWKSSGGFSFQPTDSRHPKGHVGVDMRAPGGTSIYPLTDGLVTYVGTDTFGGNVVNVAHANGVRTYYAHMGTINVRKGDTVTKESILGTIGDTGNAKGTWPHLHFQVWKNNTIQDPAKYFTVPAYQAVSSKETKWMDGQEAVAKNWKQEALSTARVAESEGFQSEYRLTKLCQSYFDVASRWASR